QRYDFDLSFPCKKKRNGELTSCVRPSGQRRCAVESVWSRATHHQGKSVATSPNSADAKFDRHCLDGLLDVRRIGFGQHRLRSSHVLTYVPPIALSRVRPASAQPTSNSKASETPFS